MSWLTDEKNFNELKATRFLTPILATKYGQWYKNKKEIQININKQLLRDVV